MEGRLTVYKASAGSGKTFTLATEYIALLLGNDPLTYRHILAVTFTNKATGEMKERILGQLYGISRSLPSSESYLRAVRAYLPGLGDDEIRRRASNVLRRIVHDYDRFSVTTIDSFLPGVMTHVAHELGLPASFHVDIGGDELIDKAVDRLMAGLQPNTPVFKRVLSYVYERIDDSKRWDITRDVKRTAKNLIREQYLIHEERLREVLDDYGVLAGLREKLRLAVAEAKDRAVNAAEQLKEMMDERGLTFESFKNGRTLGTYLNKIADGEFDKEPSKSLLGYMADAQNWIKSADRRNGELIGACEELREVLCVTEEMRKKCQEACNNYELTTEHFNSLGLLGDISRELSLLNEEANRFMLAKVPILLCRLIGSDDAPFVFEKAGTTYRHVMIDEFQDTSVLQWRNFKSLLLESMSGANSCLLVGDVKQSIYRFRNGDWRILDGIRGEFPHHPVEIRELTTNYRSARRVVEFNNRFFPKAAQCLDSFSDIDGDDRIARLYGDVRQQCAHETDAGYVRVGLFFKEDGQDAAQLDEERLEDFENRVRELHAAGIPFSDMAILVKKNEEAAFLVERFATDCPDIPLVSDGAFALAASDAVQMLIHAMRYLYDPSDAIALAYVARHHAEVPAEWADCVGKQPAALSDVPFTERREELLDLPLYELQEELITLFRLHERPGQAPYLMEFLDRVLEFLDDNPSDIGRFLEYWDETLSGHSVPTPEVSGLRVMTIHKSKGLQFHTVLLPFCDWFFERDPSVYANNRELWCEPKEPPYNELPVVPISKSRKADNSIYKADYAAEHFQQRIENLNQLYVAFTRAEQNLLVWAKSDTSFHKASSTIGQLLYAVLSEAYGEDVTVVEEGSPAVRTGAKAPKESDNRLTPSPEPVHIAFNSYKSRVEFRQSNRSQEFVAQVGDPEKQVGDPSELSGDPDGRKGDYIDQGVLLHNVFSAIGSTDDIDRVLDDYEAEGLLDGHIRKESLRKLILRGLSSPQVASWFDGSWRLFREASILAHDADGRLLIRRPDRVMTRGDETVVVDFKFGRPRDEHAGQVREYLGLLAAMGRPSPRGFLWYVYTNSVVEVKP